MAGTECAKPRPAELPQPGVGMPETEPLLSASLYAIRMERLRAAMHAPGYDWLVVWGDREHSANLAYLTGFDPGLGRPCSSSGRQATRR